MFLDWPNSSCWEENDAVAFQAPINHGRMLYMQELFVSGSASLTFSRAIGDAQTHPSSTQLKLFRLRQSNGSNWKHSEKQVNQFADWWHLVNKYGFRAKYKVQGLRMLSSKHTSYPCRRVRYAQLPAIRVPAKARMPFRFAVLPLDWRH